MHHYNLTLVILNGHWYIQDDTPHVREIFGTSLLPSPFTAAMPREDVRARIQKLNPGRTVLVRS